MGDVLGCVGEQQEGKIQALGLQWEAQASKMISAATAYPLGQNKQKLSERLVQHLLNHDGQAVPSHAGHAGERSGYSLISSRIESRI
jgi:hypothetical protein